MVSRLALGRRGYITGCLYGEAATTERIRPDDGIAFQTIIDLEQTARLIAILLDSGRSVINENQASFDDPAKVDKGFTPDVFERQLARMFRDRSGLDLADVDSARVPPLPKNGSRTCSTVSKQVVKDAQPEIDQPAARTKLIPAVFGSRVARAFHGADGRPV